MKITNDSHLALVIRLLKQIPRKYGINEDENLPFSLQIDKNIEILEKEQQVMSEAIDELVKKHALVDEAGQCVPIEGVSQIRYISEIQFVDLDAFNTELEATLKTIYDKDVQLSVIDANKIYLHKSGNKISYENFIANYLVNKILVIETGLAKVNSSEVSEEERNVIESILSRYAELDSNYRIKSVNGVDKIKIVADIKLTDEDGFSAEYGDRSKNIPVVVLNPRLIDLVGFLSKIGALKLPE